MRHGQLEVLDLCQTAVPVGDRLRAALLSTAGLTVYPGRGPREGGHRGGNTVGVGSSAGTRLCLKELNFSGARRVPALDPDSFSTDSKCECTDSLYPRCVVVQIYELSLNFKGLAKLSKLYSCTCDTSGNP